MSQTITISLTAKDGVSGVFQKLSDSAKQASTSLTSVGKAGAAGLGQMSAAATRSVADLGRMATAEQQVAASADKATASVGRTVGAYNALAGAAKGVLGSAIAGFLSESARAAADAEASQARLQQAVENTGASYDAYADQLDAAGKAAIQLGYDDEDAGDAIANLAAITGDTSKAINLLGLTMDVARGKGMDLKSASDLIGKVAAGNTAVLARYGVVLKDGATSQEALAALQQKYAGQAEAYGNTTAGAIDKARVSFGNFQETLGGAAGPLQSVIGLLPGLTSGAKLAGGAIGALTAGGGIATATEAVVAFGVALGPVGIAAAAVAIGLGALAVAVMHSGEAATKAKAQWADLDAVLTNLGVDEATQKFIDGQLNIVDAADEVRQKVGEAYAGGDGVLQTMAGAIPLSKEIADAYLLQGDEITKASGDISEAIAKTGSQALDTAKAFANGDKGLIPAYRSLTITGDDLIQVSDDIIDIFSQTGAGAEEAQKKTNALIDQYNDGAIKSKEFVTQVRSIKAAYSEATPAIVAAWQAMNNETIALDKQSAALQTATDKMGPFIEAQRRAAEMAENLAGDRQKRSLGAWGDVASANASTLPSQTRAAIEAGGKIQAAAAEAASQAEQDAADAAAKAQQDAEQARVKAVQAAAKEIIDSANKEADARNAAIDKSARHAIQLADAQGRDAQRSAQIAGNKQVASQTRAGNQLVAGAQRAADAQVDAAKRTEDETVRAAEAQADAQIQAAKDAEDAVVDAAQRQADGQIAAAEKAADASVRAVERAGAEQVREATAAARGMVQAATAAMRDAERQADAIVSAAQSKADAMQEAASKAAQDRYDREERSINHKYDLEERRAKKKYGDKAEEKHIDALERERAQALQKAQDRQQQAEEEAARRAEQMVAEAEARATEIKKQAAKEQAKAQQEADRSVALAKRDADRQTHLAEVRSAKALAATEAQINADLAATKQAAAKNEAATEAQINADLEAKKQAAAQKTAAVEAQAQKGVVEAQRKAARDLADVQRDAARSVVAEQRKTAQQVRAINRETEREHRDEIAKTAEAQRQADLLLSGTVPGFGGKTPSPGLGSGSLGGPASPAPPPDKKDAGAITQQVRIDVAAATRDAEAFAATTFTATLGADATPVYDAIARVGTALRGPAFGSGAWNADLSADPARVYEAIARVRTSLEGPAFAKAGYSVGLGATDETMAGIANARRSLNAYDRTSYSVGLYATDMTKEGIDAASKSLEAWATSLPYAHRSALDTSMLDKQIKALDKSIVGTVYFRAAAISSDGTISFFANGGVAGMANGGVSAARMPVQTAANGRAVWVGEAGPELAVLPYGTRVVPHGASVDRAKREGLGGDGQRIAIYGPVHIHAASADIAREIERQLTTRGR